jgi:hyaluronate lyase
MPSQSLSAEDFERLRRQWILTTTGGASDYSNDFVQKAFQRLSTTARGYIRTSDLHTYQIWPDLSPIQLSVNFRSSYSRLRTIASAYVSEHSLLRGDPEVLEFLLRSCDLISSSSYNSSTIVNPGENVAFHVDFALKYGC